MSASIESVDAESLRNDIMKLVRKTVEETSELSVPKLGGAAFQEGFAGACTSVTSRFFRKLI